MNAYYIHGYIGKEQSHRIRSLFYQCTEIRFGATISKVWSDRPTVEYLGTKIPWRSKAPTDACIAFSVSFYLERHGSTFSSCCSAAPIWAENHGELLEQHTLDRGSPFSVATIAKQTY
jgi:hypothetical protein